MNGYGWTALIVCVGLLAMSHWFYVERIWDLNQAHHRDLNRLREEYRMQDRMLASLTLPQVMPNNGDADEEDENDE